MHFRRLPPLAAVLFALLPTVLRGAEDSAAFFDALRGRGHYELALEYAESLDQDPSTPPKVKKRLGYERAVTLLEQAQGLTSRIAREAAVASARRDLEAFLNSGDPPLAAKASSKLAEALDAAAKRDVAAAKRLSGTERDNKINEARASFDEARQFYARSQELLSEALEPLVSVQPGSPEARERLNLRFQLAQARLRETLSLESKALTYRPSSRKFKDQLTEAAEAFAALFEKYDTAQSAGVAFYAHLYEGRCYQELGNHRLAEGCFETIVSLPANEPTLTSLITRGHAYRTITLAANQQYDKALEEGAAWLKRLSHGQQNLPETLLLKYELAETARQSADSTDRKNDKQQLLRDARDYYAAASRGFNERQADAREKLIDLNRETGGRKLTTKTFEEAYQVGVNALFSASLPGAGDQEASKREALDAFLTALSLATVETPDNQVNDARSKVAYLFYEQQDYYQAAAISEFIATHYPSDPVAEQSAKLALLSLDLLYQQAEQSGDTTFESQELVRLSEFLTRRWAGQPLADTAFGVLLATAIKNNQLDDARRVLDEAPDASRGPLALRLAIASWEKAAQGDNARAQAAAGQELAQAVSALRDVKPISDTLVTGALLLAQAKLNKGNAQASLALLEDRRIGPLKLLPQRPNLAKRPGFAAQTYRTALQAYLSSSPPRTADAMKMMKSLEKASGDAQSVIRTYLSLGIRLQKQIESLNATGKRADAERVSDAFAEFIGAIGDAGALQNWTTQQWLGQTYLSLGDRLSGSKQKEFYEQARSAFQKLKETADQDPSAAPSPNAVLAVRLQLGNAYRGLGQYEQAIDIFAGLLEEREMMLDVQKSAAYAYQEWGQESDAEHFNDAIRGAHPSSQTGKNVIWGWSKLASVSGRAARTQPKFRDTFFESWLNVATCRYLAGMKAAGATQQKQFASARQTIRLLSRQYPDLGGDSRQAEFDQLLKKIQTAESAKPVGLAEFTTQE